nr:MAG TPA: BppU domain protein [Caudoviricetes sp.]
MADTIETRILMPPVELNKGIRKTFFETLFATGNDKAHRIDVPLLRNGKTVSLSGVQVDGFFTSYAGDKTVHCAGTVSGNTVSVTLDKSCYTQTGPFAFVIQATLSGVTNTVFWGESSIFSSTAENIIDGDYIIYDLPELLKRIEAMKTATTNANNATKAASTATTNANAATKAANTATTNANNATKAANTATTNANNATKAANTAAGKIDNMTVQVSGLEAGAAPTADLSLVDGHYNLSFAIPKGDKGNTGATGATPKITVKVVTGEAGTQASVTQSGTTENPVITLTIPRGDTGSLGGLTINGKAPDGAGKVTLTAADLGALDKDVHMYNLLDNSDFVHPINQRGETSKQASWAYWIDRWLADTEKTAAQLTSSGIHLPATNEKNLRILQRVPLVRIKKGQSYTIAAYDASGNVLCVSGVFNGGTLTGDGLSEGKYYLSLQSGDNSTYYYCILDAYADITVKCMALYEGEYTAETLPPYVPKGYAAELAECLRYYRRITATNETFAGYCANGVSYCMIPLQTMRIKPSLVPSGKFYYTLGNKQGTTTATATAHSANVNRAIIKCAITETGILTGTISPQGDIDISADL